MKSTTIRTVIWLDQVTSFLTSEQSGSSDLKRKEELKETSENRMLNVSFRRKCYRVDLKSTKRRPLCPVCLAVLAFTTSSMLVALYVSKSHEACNMYKTVKNALVIGNKDKIVSESKLNNSIDQRSGRLRHIYIYRGDQADNKPDMSLRAGEHSTIQQQIATIVTSREELKPKNEMDGNHVMLDVGESYSTDTRDTGRRQLNLVDFRDPKSVVLKGQPPFSQNQQMQLQQVVVQQPAPEYTSSIASIATQTQQQQQQQQQQQPPISQNQQMQLQQAVVHQYPPEYISPIASVGTHTQQIQQLTVGQSPVEQLGGSATLQTTNGVLLNDPANNQNIEIPQHMRQKPTVARAKEDFLDAAAFDAIKNPTHSVNSLNMKILQQGQPVGQQLTKGLAGAAKNIEIPQHMMPAQHSPEPKQPKNIFPVDYAKLRGKEPTESMRMQHEEMGLELPLDELAVDLNARWGEPSQEETEESEVILLPNQEQECPKTKFDPEAHQFDPAPKNLTIDETLELNGYKDVWNWKILPTDLPVFWHIPKSGGSTIKDIMGSCHRFVMATEAGIREGHMNDTVLAIVKVVGKEGTLRDGATPFINVDTTTVEGMQRAKQLGLAQCGLAKVIVIRHVFEAGMMFDSEHKGRLFALFRHPIDRQVSLFNYLKIATWEPTYNPEMANMTLREYVRSPYVEYNWLTRYLSGDREGTLTQAHMRTAMDVVRRKFLVGLLSRRDETMERFEQYFEWTYRVNPKNQEICRDKLLKSGANTNANQGEKAKPNTPTYEILLSLNKYDIQLYNYIESLFDEQADFVKDKKAGFRLEGATCCKCHRYPQC